MNLGNLGCLKGIVKKATKPNVGYLRIYVNKANSSSEYK